MIRLGNSTQKVSTQERHSARKSCSFPYACCKLKHNGPILSFVISTLLMIQWCYSGENLEKSSESAPWLCFVLSTGKALSLCEYLPACNLSWLVRSSSEKDCMGSKPERMLTAALVSGSTREQDELVLAFLMTNHSNTGAEGYFFFNCRCFCYPWLPRMEKAAPPLLFAASPRGLQAVGQCCAGSRGAGQQ